MKPSERKALEAERLARAAKRGRVRDGVAYVRQRPDILLIMVLVFVHGTFGMNFQLFNALMATEVYGKGVEEFGVTGSIMAIGSLAGALLAARRERPRWRLLLGAMIGFSACLMVVGAAPSFWTYTLLLIPTGLAALTVMVSANAMVQLTTDQAVRGRVMALYMAVFMGGTPIGSEERSLSLLKGLEEVSGPGNRRRSAGHSHVSSRGGRSRTRCG